MDQREQFTPIPLGNLTAKDFTIRTDSWSSVYERLFKSTSAEIPDFLLSLYKENGSGRSELLMHLSDVPELSLPLNIKKTYIPRLDVVFKYDRFKQLVTGFDRAAVWIRDLTTEKNVADTAWYYYLIYRPDESLPVGSGRLDEITLYSDGASTQLVEKALRRHELTFLDSELYRSMNARVGMQVPEIVDWERVLREYSLATAKALTAQKIFADPLNPLSTASSS